MEEPELNGSVALVTGGGQGLGFAFAEVLVKNGAYVSLLDINEEVGNKAINHLEDKHKMIGRVLFLKCDVTNKEMFENAFKKTVEIFGKINIVINNAGIMTKYISLWEQAIDLNFKSVVHGTILGLKYITNEFENNSAVINVGSITGLSNSILPMYQSTKRAVIEFTRSIGCPYNSEANNNRVRVMALCPGCTFDGLENDRKNKEDLECKMKVFITSGEDNPNPDRKILIQSTKFIKNALIHVIKNGKTGHVWIAENEEPPRLANFSDQY